MSGEQSISLILRFCERTNERNNEHTNRWMSDCSTNIAMKHISQQVYTIQYKCMVYVCRITFRCTERALSLSQVIIEQTNNEEVKKKNEISLKTFLNRNVWYTCVECILKLFKLKKFLVAERERGGYTSRYSIFMSWACKINFYQSFICFTVFSLISNK